MSDRVVVLAGPGRVELRTEEAQPPREGTFRVETVYSGVSTGTELSYVKGTNPHLRGGWDPELGLFRPGVAATPYPVTRLGYMEVGRVVASATPAVAEGLLLAMAYGHRTGYLADPLVDRFVPLPDDLDPLLGVYVAHLGPTCANGLLHAAADLYGPNARELGDGVRGRRVAVTGAGVVGLLTALFARAHGAASTVLLDPTPRRREVAAALGLTALDPQEQDVALLLKSAWAHGKGDRGADVVFQCRGQAGALQLGLRLLRPQGTVVDLAFYQSGAGDLRLGEEFHHNGLTVRCAQVGRVPRELAASWDRERLSLETIGLLRLYADILRRHVVSAVVPFDEAPRLLTDLAQRRRDETQVIFAGDRADEWSG
ncbi:zinc-binding alcohol dehydrogenase [Micromonospora sp. NPDC049559]|uniref:zinc-dependent alcohol dehydrogenase n=1 Tax=Micromonospora sp. NPDC049559 TaxID=3155923 RepID=UPI003448CA29